PTDPQQRNRYTYTSNNPLVRYDLNGMWWGGDAWGWVEDKATDFGGGVKDVANATWICVKNCPLIGAKPGGKDATEQIPFWGAGRDSGPEWLIAFEDAMNDPRISTSLLIGIGVPGRTGWVKCSDDVGNVVPGASSLTDQLALREAMTAPGKRIMEGFVRDLRYPENIWAKKQYVHESLDGTKTVVHYWENLQTGVREGFKIK
ncbi:MAG: hypothetical protein ACYC4M_04340, partial [Thermoleophilia bacterium]